MKKEFDDSEYHDLKKRHNKKMDTRIRKNHEKRIKNILRSGHIDDILEYYDEDY